MDGQQGRHDEGVLSRSELEVELAALALAVKRAAQERRERPRAAEGLLAAAVQAFLDASLRLLGRTRRLQHAWMVSRLSELAASSELGIIGFEEWLAGNEAYWRRASEPSQGSDDRRAAG